MARRKDAELARYFKPLQQRHSPKYVRYTGVFLKVKGIHPFQALIMSSGLIQRQAASSLITITNYWIKAARSRFKLT